MELGAPDGPYIALSYTWGDAQPTESIYLNGLLAKVTLNLKSALKRLRGQLEWRRVWVDALCINQGESPAALQERGQQVRMIGDIFPRASEVVAYLGEDDFEASIKTAPSIAAQIVAGTLLPSEHNSWTFWDRFWCRPWFRRPWIVQDHIVARKFTFLLSDVAFDSGDFASCVLRDEKGFIPSLRNVWSPDAGAAITGLRTMSMFGEDWSVAQSLDAIRVDLIFEYTRIFNVTDSRDRVYASLGLFPAMAADFDVDYVDDIPALSKRFAIYLLSQSYPFRVLNIANGPQDGMPSWVPDLKQHRQSSIYCEESGFPEEPFASGGRLTYSIRLGNYASPSDVLTVKGIVWGSIFQATSPGPERPLSSNITQETAKFSRIQLFMKVIDWLAAALELVRAHPCFRPDFSPLDERFWRTFDP